jgi:hypothetical protein
MRHIGHGLASEGANIVVGIKSGTTFQRPKDKLSLEVWNNPCRFFCLLREGKADATSTSSASSKSFSGAPATPNTTIS